MDSGNVIQWILAGAAAVAIVGGLLKGVIFLLRIRRQNIDSLRMALARTWTNEGDINSKEFHFVDLVLTLENGDLFGTISSRILGLGNENRTFEARVRLHWGSATLEVSRLLGRELIPVGKVRLRLARNQNRLIWKLIWKSIRESYTALPEKTVLWPVKPKPGVRWI